MGNSKLVRTLATLSKDEWSSLRKFILMTSSDVSDNFSLFTILYKRKEKLKKDFDIKIIGKKYFSKLTDKGFGNLQSRVFSTVEEWLAIKQFQSEKQAQNLALLRALNSRGLYKEADQVANKIEKSLADNEGHDTKDSEILKKVYHTQYYSDNPIKYRDKTNLINNLINNHTKSYKYQSQLYLCELFNWGALNNIDFGDQVDLLRTSIARIEGEELSDHLDYLEKLISSFDINSFEELKKSLLNAAYSRGTELHVIITMYLIIYSLKLYTNGSLSNLDILLQVNEYGLESGVLLKSGKIPQSRFYNLVSTIGGIKDYEWTNEFINKWIEKVDTQNIKSTLSLANAYNSFYHQDYRKVRIFLNDVKFDYLLQKIRALGLLMLALYKENSANDLILNHIENYKRTLKRNKSGLSLGFYDSYWNLIRVVEYLMNRDYVSEEINLSNFKNLSFRRWCITELK